VVAKRKNPFLASVGNVNPRRPVVSVVTKLTDYTGSTLSTDGKIYLTEKGTKVWTELGLG